MGHKKGTNEHPGLWPAAFAPASFPFNIPVRRRRAQLTGTLLVEQTGWWLVSPPWAVSLREAAGKQDDDVGGRDGGRRCWMHRTLTTSCDPK